MSPAVFISYSHKDERWKDALVRQLGVLEREGLLATWHDGLIEPGADWLPAIQTAMAEAHVAVFIVSADFLNSKFVRSKEIPALLERRRREGLRIIPLIARPCPWQQVPWLAAIQSRPLDGKTLASLSRVKAEQVLSDLAEEILRLAAPRAASPPGDPAPRTSAPPSDPPGPPPAVPPVQLPPGPARREAAPPQREAKSQGASLSGATPVGFLAEAVHRLPVVAWAIGVGGVVAIAVIVSAWKPSPMVAIFGSLGLFVGMFGLFIFSALIAPSHVAKPPLVSLFVLWAFSVLLVGSGFLGASSLFFDSPIPLRTLLFPTRPEATNEPRKVTRPLDADVEELMTPKLQPKVPIAIRAQDYVRGTNVAIDQCVEGPGTLANAAPCNTAPNAAEFDFVSSAAGAYRLDINFTAAASRPVKVTLNGTAVRDEALSETTGSWLNSSLRWFEVGRVVLKEGANTIRLERSDVFPHIHDLRLVPVPD
ncbi:MAG TPA: TIR domain-containing protein [Thermoanaerobaculia bacterium]|jgi:hypothetical protein|nr:TIR domain-containing protein [Thermoanaerobaculia bacterium]